MVVGVPVPKDREAHQLIGRHGEDDGTVSAFVRDVRGRGTGNRSSWSPAMLPESLGRPNRALCARFDNATHSTA